MLIFIVVQLFLLLTSVNGFWRHECKGHLGVARIDPIVSPGNASSHAHIAFGGSNFGLTTTADDLFASACSSCSIVQDRSAYWTPPLYFQHANGTFELIPVVGGSLVYYFTEPPDVGGKVTAYPQGFRMIAGNNTKREFYGPVPDPPMAEWQASDMTQVSLMEKSTGFNCLDYNQQNETEGSLTVHYIRPKSFYDQNCPNGLRAELQFPSCWNGKDLDSPDHMSHVAYPSRLRNGDCPQGFPVRLPTLFYETIYDTNLFRDYDGIYVFANGDPHGYAYHGDFITAWDDGVLQAAIDNPICTTLDEKFHISDGVQGACPIFKLQSELDAVLCKMEMPSILMDEPVSMLDVLPGNVTVEFGPQPVKASTAIISTIAASRATTTSPYASSTMIVSPNVTTTNTMPTIYPGTIHTGNKTITHVVVVEEVVTETVFVKMCPTHKARHVHRHHRHH